MIKFREHLNHLYTSTKKFLTEQQIFTPIKFVNLLLTSHVEKNTSNQLSLYADIVSKGLKSDQSYTTCNIADIFKHGNNYKTNNDELILIGGAPGIGKTILCKEIAYRWTCNELLSGDQLVLLIFLRDPSIQNINSIESLIHYFYKFEKQANSISKACAKYLFNVHGKNVTIIFDGYDEIAQPNCTNNFLSHLFHKEILPQCRIVVTSRPIASVALQKRADLVVEILGFTEESRQDFITSELIEKPYLLKKVTSYLEQNSTLNHLCTIPFFLSILVCVVIECEEIPANQTELYEKFIVVTVSHFLNKLRSLPLTIVSLKDLITFEYGKYFLELCKYAFITLLNNKLVFTRNEIKKEFPELANAPGNWDGLGLLKSAKYFSFIENSDNTSYNFLHLSIQEYLAAFYITTLDTKKQIGMLYECFFVEKYLNMWIMYNGLAKDLHAFKHFLSGNRFQIWTRLSESKSISHKHLKSNIKRFYLFQCFSELKDLSMCSVVGSIFQSGILDLSQCRMSLKDIDTLLYLLDRSAITEWKVLNLSQCFIRDDGCLHLCRGICKLTHPIFFDEVNFSNNLLTVDSVENVIGMLMKCKTKKIYVTSNVMAKDGAKIAYFVMEYAFVANDMTHPLSIIARNQESLVLCQMDSEKVHLFLNNKYMITGLYYINCQISDYVVQKLHIHRKLLQLYIWNSNLDYKILLRLLSILPQYKLDQLLFVYENIDIDEIVIIALITKFPFFTFIFLNESSLMIYNASYTHISHMIFSNPMLPEVKKLQTVCLSNYKQGNAVIELLENFFSHCNIISKLIFLHNGLRNEVMEHFMSTLKLQNSLREVLVHENNLAGNDLYNIGNHLLKYDETIKALLMNDKILISYNCSDEQLKYAVGRITLFTTLIMGYCCFKDDTAVVMDQLIKSSSSHLKEIVIFNSLTKTQNNVQIFQSISSITTLLYLNLTGNVITTEAAEVLAFIISNNTKLEELHLGNNQLNLKAIRIITSALKDISSLKVLDMKQNNLPAEVTNDLAASIKANTSLQELWIRDNHFGSLIIEILNALTNHQNLKVFYLCGNENKDASISTAIASIVENNKLLESLLLSNNNLKTDGAIVIGKSLINISGLKAINFQYNAITEQAAEVLASVILKNTGLEKLYLGYNQLRQAGITRIANALETISSLKVLDLNGNAMFEKVDVLAVVIEANSLIEKLWLSDNHLGSSMAVILKACSNLHGLKQLKLDNTNISEMVADHLAAVLEANLFIEWLTLSDNNLESSGFIKLAQKLKSLTFLTYFYGHNINVTSAVGKALVSVIENNSSLIKISLGDNFLETSLLLIAESCSGLNNLKLLELSNNCVGATELLQLISSINNTSLVSLSLGGITLSTNENLYLNIFNIIKTSNRMFTKTNDIVKKKQNCINKKIEIMCSELLRMKRNRDFLLNYDELYWQYNYCFTYINYKHKDKFHQIKNEIDCVRYSQEATEKLSQINSRAIMSSLQITRKLKVINLENNNVNENAAIELAEHLHYNNILEQLWLRGNELYDKGALVVLRSLHNLSTLLILDLSFNHLSSESADGIAVVISNNFLLQQVWLDGNNLLTRGVVIIASALKTLSSIRVLSLCSNGITDDAAEEICDVITNNVLLVDLCLGNNQLQAMGVCKITVALRKLLMLKKLDLFNNYITPDAAEELAVTLSNCSNLQQLFLSDNILGTEGTIKIANTLKYIDSLQVLTLGNNNITESAADVLVDVLKNNISLTIVLIGGNDLQTTGIKSIVQTAKNIVTLQLLDVSGNSVSEDVKESFKIVFANNSYVTIIV